MTFWVARLRSMQSASEIHGQELSRRFLRQCFFLKQGREGGGGGSSYKWSFALTVKFLRKVMPKWMFTREYRKGNGELVIFKKRNMAEARWISHSKTFRPTPHEEGEERRRWGEGKEHWLVGSIPPLFHVPRPFFPHLSLVVTHSEVEHHRRNEGSSQKRDVKKRLLRLLYNCSLLWCKSWSWLFPKRIRLLHLCCRVGFSLTVEMNFHNCWC